MSRCTSASFSWCSSIAPRTSAIAWRCSRKRFIVSRFMVVRQRSSCAVSSWWVLMYSAIFSASGLIFCARVSE